MVIEFQGTALNGTDFVPNRAGFFVVLPFDSSLQG